MSHPWDKSNFKIQGQGNICQCFKEKDEVMVIVVVGSHINFNFTFCLVWGNIILCVIKTNHFFSKRSISNQASLYIVICSLTKKKCVSGIIPSSIYDQLYKLNTSISAEKRLNKLSAWFTYNLSTASGILCRRVMAHSCSRRHCHLPSGRMHPPMKQYIWMAITEVLFFFLQRPQALY